MTRRVIIALAFLVGAWGCGSDWTAPTDAVRFDPPPAYRIWWEASRACVHRIEWLRYDQVEWYVTPDRIIAPDGDPHGALVSGHAVYIWERNTDIPWVIQHELVHAINRVQGHPADPFETCNLLGVTP